MKSRLEALFRACTGHNRILVLPHNDPDPDAIASAYALRHLLSAQLNASVEIVYRGIIGRAENKALVHYLGRPLRLLNDKDLRPPVAVALVDTQPGAGNVSLPPEIPVAAVFDHHFRRAETDAAAFADVRPNAGATATILAGYLFDAGITLTQRMATALFYGIKTDTMGLARGATKADVAAYFDLQPHIDVEALGEIERAQVPAEYFRTLADTLHTVKVFGYLVVGYVGPMTRPDLAAEMADLLLRLDGTQWVICLGVYEAMLVLAVRTRIRPGKAGQLAQAMVANRGTAGGHGSMAGGQIALDGEDAEQLTRQLVQRALEYLQLAPDVQGKPLL